MMEKKWYEKKKKVIFITKKRKKELRYLNSLLLLRDYKFLSLCLIINFFRTKISLYIKIKNLVDIILSYLSTIKIITEMKMK